MFIVQLMVSLSLFLSLPLSAKKTTRTTASVQDGCRSKVHVYTKMSHFTQKHNVNIACFITESDYYERRVLFATVSTVAPTLLR